MRNVLRSALLGISFLGAEADINAAQRSKPPAIKAIKRAKSNILVRRISQTRAQVFVPDLKDPNKKHCLLWEIKPDTDLKLPGDTEVNLPDELMDPTHCYIIENEYRFFEDDDKRKLSLVRLKK